MITVFGSSTAYNSFPPGKSYVDLLWKGNMGDLTSYCMNGYTIWHANYILPNLLNQRGPGRHIILHVGACEAISMKASNFLVTASHWLNFGQVDHYFMTFIAPKILQAAIDIHAGKEDAYYSFLTVDEFRILYRKVLQHLSGFSVLAMGMSRPNTGSDIRKTQAADFNAIIDEECAKVPGTEYVNVWGLCRDEVVDSNHLTEKGHAILYEEITRRMG